MVKHTKKIVFVTMAVLALIFVSCREKDKSAKKAEVQQEETPVQEVVSEDEPEEDFGGWFMAQTSEAPVKSVMATSELVEAQYEGRYLYPPINILDGDFDSTWCEADENGSGIGESLTVEFWEPVSFDEIQIVNGFASKDYYEKNNRVKSILLTQTASTMVPMKKADETTGGKMRTMNHFQQKEYTLQDGVADWQSIKFDLPQTAQIIKLEILDIYKGEKYDDTCLDDIRLLYKGNVIPFTNLEALKILQEENSRQMLEEQGDYFEQQFNKLFKGGNEIYLIGDDPNDILTIIRYDDYDDERINLLYGDSVLLKLTTKEALFKDLQDLACRNSYIYRENETLPSDWRDFRDQYKDFPLTQYLLVGYKWESYRTSYSLGNHRILKHESIDYVDTTTAIIASINGNTLSLNGTNYKVLTTEHVTDWRLWEGL